MSESGMTNHTIKSTGQWVLNTVDMNSSRYSRVRSWKWLLEHSDFITLPLSLIRIQIKQDSYLPDLIIYLIVSSLTGLCAISPY